jgi:DNA uptake protein ComE-like DNA-binding protein
VLIVICITLAYIPRVIANWNDSSISVSLESLKQAEKKVEELQKQKQFKKKGKKSNENRKERYQKPPQRFDPNNYAKEDWMALGLTSKQSDVVLKFTERGVYSNEELRKIFVIPEEVFQLIEDSTVYPNRPDFATNKEVSALKKEFIIDLNAATQEELKQLTGIGEFYAKKIVERREELGGYVSQDQLLEIWKFGTERLDKIKGNLAINGAVRKLNVNTASFETLYEHPYISYKVANSIVKMRAAHGNFHSLEDIMKSVLIDRELFLKIKPYLTI